MFLYYIPKVTYITRYYLSSINFKNKKKKKYLKKNL